MKNLLLFSVAATLAMNTFGQCPQITCQGDTTLYSGSASCDVVYNYTSPQGIDPCLTGNQTFAYTGSVQTFTVPSGVTSVTFDVIAGSGGDFTSATGGNGGRVQGVLSVTPGDILYINVGGAGITSGNQPSGAFTGGGGVYSYNSCGQSGTGGGASDIRLNGTTLADRVVVAGGGGGAGGYSGTLLNGGSGGGLTGGDGQPWPSWPNSGGKGGTPSAGGAAGLACCDCPTYTTAGALGLGGNGSGDCAGGGGGGGGYYGGGGSCFGGAGGGSSYTAPSVMGVVHTAGYQNGDGMVILSYNGTTISTIQTVGMPSGSAFPIGTTMNTYEATDGLGNTVTCSFNVTVMDTVSPVPDVASLTDFNAVCSASPTAPTATDNCSGVLTGTPDVTLPITAYGTTVITWTFDDGNGNTSTQSQNVIVVVGVDTTVSQNGITITSNENGASSTYQWYDCGNAVILPGETNQSYTPSANGDYAVIVSDGNCSDTSACISINDVGLTNIYMESGISIHPNPTADGVVFIEFDKIMEGGRIIVYDASGRKVNETAITSKLMEIETGSEAGVYMLNIGTEETNQLVRVIRK